MTQIIRSVKNSHIEILQIFDPTYRGLPQALIAVKLLYYHWPLEGVFE
jgi:hypothetical protein